MWVNYSLAAEIMVVKLCNGVLKGGEEWRHCFACGRLGMRVDAS
jgi:hypothetical protein